MTDLVSQFLRWVKFYCENFFKRSGYAVLIIVPAHSRTISGVINDLNYAAKTRSNKPVQEQKQTKPKLII